MVTEYAVGQRVKVVGSFTSVIGERGQIVEISSIYIHLRLDSGLVLYVRPYEIKPVDAQLMLFEL